MCCKNWLYHVKTCVLRVLRETIHMNTYNSVHRETCAAYRKKHFKWWNRWLGNIHKVNLSAVLVMASFKQLTEGFKIYSINIQTTIILQNCVAKGIFARITFSLNITNYTTNMGLLEIILLTNFMIRYILSVDDRCKRRYSNFNNCNFIHNDVN